MDERRSHRNRTGKTVVGDVKVSEARLIKCRDFSGQTVVFQEEHVQSAESDQRRRDLAGDLVSGQDDNL